MKEPMVEPPQVSNQLEPDGSGLGCSVPNAGGVCGGTRRLLIVRDRRGCREGLRRTGSKLQGNSRAPHSSTDQR